MTRKSPYRHPVKTYTKHNGTVVRRYERGKGKKKTVLSKPKMRASAAHSSSGRYNVYITYVEEIAPENYVVSANDYPSAVTAALSKRSHITPPYQVKVDKI